MSGIKGKPNSLIRFHFQNLVSSLTFFALLFVLAPNIAFAAESCKDLVTTTASLNDTNWNFTETTIDWREMNEKGQTIFYAVAGLTKAGVLHFNLKLVSEDGATRSKQMTGRLFTTKALEYFKGKGRLVPAIKGWWVFRPDTESNLTLEQQVEENPNLSINFHDYWKSRKRENDIEAAKSTWTSKMAAALGFPVIAKVAEYTIKNDYKSVYVTYLAKDFNIEEARKAILGDQEEVLLPLRDSFLEAGMGEDLHDSRIASLFNFTIDQETLIKIVETNSQVASDLKLLGLQIVGVELVTTKRGRQVFLRVR